MIEVKNLVKRYGDHVAVNNLSFTVEEGQIYGFLGPNGAGKSTTMNIITGYLASTEGEVLINGHNILEEPEEAKKCIGYLPELPPVYTDMTVLEYLKFVAELKKIPKDQRKKQILEVMNLVKITDMQNRLIKNLSKGYRQRVGLAQAVLGYPPIIILDEPTAGLDPRQRIAVRNLIAEIALQKIVIVSTHVVPDVEYVASELLLLSEGRLLRKASPAELTHELAGQVWEAELAESELPAAQAAGTVCGIARVDAGHIRVRLLAEKQPPFACRPLAPELEDVYLHYFGAEDGL